MFLVKLMSEPFKKLEDLITKVPAVQMPIAKGTYENGFWWMKFSIDITHDLAWNIVQYFSHVINYLSISERLSTVFYPVSSLPVVGESPALTLAWIIETTSQDFTPNELAEWLSSRLPSPLDNEKVWTAESE